MLLSLTERLTFDKLFRISEPKRVYRSFTVKGPPLEIDSYQDAVYYIFNFKSNPSTTGLRHRGYVKFFKPKGKNPKDIPLQHLDCQVDCGCPDYRYRWAWSNKQRQSGVVGPQSLNQAWNKAPRKTNPHGKPGLCKHLLAARQYIYGLLSSFPGDEPDTAYKLDRLTRHATKRWSDFEGQSRAAKEKEAEIRRRRELRNAGQLPTVPPTAPSPVRQGQQPTSVDTPKRTPANKAAKATTDFKKAVPEPLPLAEPPGYRTKAAPATPAPASDTPGGRPQTAVSPTPAPVSKPKRALGNRVVKPLKPGDAGWNRPEESCLCTPAHDLILESVVSTNGEFMSNIKAALKLVEEMEADELSLSRPDSSDDFSGSGLEPSEPPVSDSAVGADTEGDTALSLLRSMKTSLEQIAAVVAPAEATTVPTTKELPARTGEEEVEADVPDEPPSAIETEEEEAEEGEAEEGEEDEEQSEG